jgi:CSLREA domain-containing protein
MTRMATQAWSSVTAPAHGAAAIVGRVVHCTATADFLGQDSFTYTASDGVVTGTAAVIVMVIADRPVTAVDDVAVTARNTPISIGVLDNDNNPDWDGYLAAVGTPGHGAAQISGDRVTYTPTPGYRGVDVFTYTLTDGTFSDTGVVTVAVGAIVVDSPLDKVARDGKCTLREAIHAANLNLRVDTCLPGQVGFDVIFVPAGVYTLTLAGAGEDQNFTGDLDILEDLTLVGRAAASTIIDGNALDRVLHVVNAGVTANVSYVTLRNGRLTDFDDKGAGVYNSGALILTHVVISGNSNSGDSGEGGGLYNEGALSITYSSLLNNQTTGGWSNGGGIANAGALTLTYTTLVSNSNSGYANDGGGGIYNTGTSVVYESTFTTNTADYGGGLYNATGVVTVSNSNFTQNAAERGGAFYNFGGRLTVQTSLIYDNYASQWGGGIKNYHHTVPALLLMTDSTVSGNSAEDGGIHNTGTGAVTLVRSTVNSNSGSGISNDGYEAVVQATNCTFSENDADGLTNASGTVQITNCTLSGNHGNGVETSDGTVTVDYSTFSGNGNYGVYNYLGVMTLNHSLITSSASAACDDYYGTFNGSRNRFDTAVVGARRTWEPSRALIRYCATTAARPGRTRCSRVAMLSTRGYVAT